MKIAYSRIKTFRDRIQREKNRLVIENKRCMDKGRCFTEYQNNCNRIAGITYVMNEFDQLVGISEQENKKHEKYMKRKLEGDEKHDS